MIASDATDHRFETLRHALVENMQRRGVITDQRIAEAFASVPRHLFLPGLAPERVYSDQAIITKEQDGVGISSSSQPAMMAIQLQQLLLEPGQRVLEIGAGTGYNAALMRFLVGPTGRVTTVDVDDDIVEAARAQVAAAGYPDIQVILGDGGYGYAPNAPYDRIILTVGASDILPTWVEQLRPDGLLVLPINLGSGMFSVAFRTLTNGTLISESLTPCGFIRLRGAFASAEQLLTTGEWDIYCDPGPRLDPAQLSTLLQQPAADAPVPADTIDATLFLAFSGEPMAKLFRRTANGDPPIEGGRHALFDTTAMSGCLLPPWTEPAARHEPALAQTFGSPAAYDRLRALLTRWAALGRPGLNQLRVLVTPHGTTPPPPGAMTITRPYSALTLAGRDGRGL
jgi:protein-L-isoaspartate(D-aspartate) O-methyltransferase